MAVSIRYLALAPFLTVLSASNVTSRRSRLAEEVLSGKYFILSPEVLDLLQNTYKITKYAPTKVTRDCL